MAANELIQKLKEVDQEQNSLLNSTCQECRPILQFQELYFESSKLEKWECGHSCNSCGVNWRTLYFKDKDKKI